MGRRKIEKWFVTKAPSKSEYKFHKAVDTASEAREIKSTVGNDNAIIQKSRNRGGNYSIYIKNNDVIAKYKIFEGTDPKKGTPLYRVTGVDNEYVGEWHAEKEDVQKELDGLSKNSKLEKGGGIYAKSGDIPYNKEIYDKNGVLIKVGDRLKGDWTTTRGSGRFSDDIEGVVQSSKNYPVPAIAVLLENGNIQYLQPEYDYSQSKFILKSSSNNLNLGIEVISPYKKSKKTYAEGGKIDNSHQHTYMMLGRLQSDNDYFLGAGGRSERNLWAGNVDAQISEMKKLWNSLPKNSKPEWLSMEDILDYETKMKDNPKDMNYDYQVVRGADDSIVISNGNDIKKWDFTGSKETPPSQIEFKKLKTILTYDSISANSFKEAYEIWKSKYSSIRKKSGDMDSKISVDFIEDSDVKLTIDGESEADWFKAGEGLINSDLVSETDSIYILRDSRGYLYEVPKKSVKVVESVKLEKGGDIWLLKGIGSKGLSEIKSLSKDNPSKLYLVTDDNYSNIGFFYLRNGKLAKRTVANENYDFANNKVNFKGKSDVIYKVKELKNKLEKGGMIHKTRGKAKFKPKSRGKEKGTKKGWFEGALSFLNY